MGCFCAKGLLPVFFFFSFLFIAGFETICRFLFLEDEDGFFCLVELCHSSSTCADTVLLPESFAPLDSHLVKLVLVKPQK